LQRRRAVEAGEAEEGEHLLDAPRYLGAFEAASTQPIGDVLEHRQMREERVVLEHHHCAATLRRDLVHAAALDADLAGVRLHEAGDQAKQGGLAAAAWAEQGRHLALRRRQAHLGHRRDRAEALAEPDQLDMGLRHR
jgi:hypothetical protein